MQPKPSKAPQGCLSRVDGGIIKQYILKSTLPSSSSSGALHFLKSLVLYWGGRCSSLYVTTLLRRRLQTLVFRLFPIALSYQLLSQIVNLSIITCLSHKSRPFLGFSHTYGSSSFILFKKKPQALCAGPTHQCQPSPLSSMSEEQR